jgi:hypothetical protein
MIYSYLINSTNNKQGFETNNETLISFSIDKNLKTDITVGGLVSWGLIAALFVIIVVRTTMSLRLKKFEIDEAEFGLGNQKIKLRPNTIDMQIAYKIWVELSTRKIGLPMDFENDVIAEVYDSWYSFFAVTRTLIKEVPVSKFRRPDTEAIIQLSIEVLNSGIRPHLTLWQAKFNRWFENELTIDENKSLSPQEIQKKFPEYEALVINLRLVNQRLIQYRKKMHELVTSG